MFNVLPGERFLILDNHCVIHTNQDNHFTAFLITFRAGSHFCRVVKINGIPTH